MRVAVIDVGSNSVRLLIASVKRGGQVRELDRERIYLRLGDDAYRLGRIGRGKLDELAETAERYALRARAARAAWIETIVTAPGRQAANADELVDLLADATRAPVVVLTAEDENRLAWEAPLRSCRPPAKRSEWSTSGVAPGLGGTLVLAQVARRPTRSSRSGKADCEKVPSSNSRESSQRRPSSRSPLRYHWFPARQPAPVASRDRLARMTQTLDPITLRHIQKLTESLVDDFIGVFSHDTIERYVLGSVDLLDGARFSDFVPVLSYRFASERLKALAQAEGIVTKEQPEVLFVCVHNAGRSQMAAGLVRLRSDERIHVRSAGSDPAGSINPAVLKAMAEIGVDMSEEFPKPLTDEVVRAADVVITMGCGDACPIYPGKRYEDWALEDPAGQDLEAVRQIRDDLDARIVALVSELTPADK